MLTPSFHGVNDIVGKRRLIKRRQNLGSASLCSTAGCCEVLGR